MRRPPWDPVKHAFWLVSVILGVQCVVVLAAVGACLWWSRAIVEGRFECIAATDKVKELLVGALAAALALSGSRRDK